MLFYIRKVILALIFATFAGVGATDTEAETRPVQVCIAANDGAEVFAREANSLGAVNCAATYMFLGQQRLEYSAFPPGIDNILVLKFPDGKNFPNGTESPRLLSRIIAGEFDKQLAQLADSIEADGRQITLRPIAEANGHWNPWGIFWQGKFKPGNKPEEFAPAWKHIVSVIRSRTPTTHPKFDMNINRRPTEGFPLSFDVMYPGPEWVDSVSISSYNRCGSSKTRTTPHTFAAEFAPAYEAVEKVVGPNMPIDIAETATMDTCGTDKEHWYGDLFTAVQNRFPRVRRIVFFLKPVGTGKASNSIVLHWELDPDKGEVNMFRGLLTQFRVNMGIEPPPYIGGGGQIGQAWNTTVEANNPWHIPYNVWGRMEEVFPLGDPKADPFARFVVIPRIGLMYDVPGSFGLQIGPELYGRFGWGDDSDRFWDQNWQGGIRLLGCQKTEENATFAGKFCIYGGIDYTKYYGDSVPESQKGGIWDPSIGFQFNYYGDFIAPSKRSK